MHPRTVLVALASAAFATAAFSQSTSSPPDQGKSNTAAQKQSAKSKASYGADDCQKDMANARDAKQAGHITEKELAEQKKMAQTKMKRDSGQSASAITGGDCK